MLTLPFEPPEEQARQIAARARRLRLLKNLSQEGLALRSGVSLGSLRRFERTGEISLHSLLKLAFALNAAAGFGALFPEPEFRSIEEVIHRPRERKRGRKT